MNKARRAMTGGVVLSLVVLVPFLPSPFLAGVTPAVTTTAHVFVPTAVALPLQYEVEPSPTF